MPQFLPSPAHVAGVHPHTFAVLPPPHVFGDAQLPHSSMPPHPSGIRPQFFPCNAHVVGVHPQALGLPPPPHVFGSVQSAFVQQLPTGRHMLWQDTPGMATRLQPVSPRQLSVVQALPSLQLSNVATPHVPLPVHDGARV
jgi:hypothetical protein